VERTGKAGPGGFRWGILGTAGIAATFVRAVAGAGGAAGRVEAVASRDLGRAEAWAGAHGVPQAFGSYQALLAARAVDAVYVPLPNSLHAAWSVAALEAGCPVLCEKPLCPTLAEALQVREAARRSGLHAAEGFMYRHHPLHARLLELARGGAVGRLTNIAARFTFRLDDGAATPASAALGGGALLDVGCYAVHLARAVAGAEPLRAVALARGARVDELFTGLLEFPGGVHAVVEAGIATAERHGAEISGEEASLVVESPWFPGLDQGRLLRRRFGAPDEEIVTPGGDCYALQAEEFAAVCRGARPPRYGLDDAVANAAACEALARAAREGRAVAVERAPWGQGGSA